MAWDAQQFGHDFVAAIDRFDRPETQRLCGELISHLRSSVEPYDEAAAKSLLGHLQRKRYFDLLQQVADAFLQTGQAAARIRRQYAQALLDQGGLSAAVPFLEELARETEGNPDQAFENAEARGLLGRAFKQIYVDTSNAARAEARSALNKSIGLYHSVYTLDPAKYTWQGINTAALLHRAATDSVPVDGIDDPQALAKALAAEILALMTAKWENREATMWDSGTALEASIALGDLDQARDWLNRYVREPRADAFELASTLRQLEEVWRLDVDSEPGASLLPVLRAELLRREGGSLEVKAEQLRPGLLADQNPENLEKILGKVRYLSYKFMLRAMERARAVARIEHQPDQGFGTGFIVRGGDLFEPLGDELLLLTNSHVVSNNEAVVGALAPEDTIVTFQLLKEEGADEEYSVAEVAWTSPPWELDATLLRLEDIPQDVEVFPVTPRLPLADGEQRVYVIGHPKGGSLSFSIQDNVLLDHEAPRLHYRAPTEGGSSGSPVFNSQWKLIALHHAGSKEMRKLHRQPGTYAANEGIWIQSIIEAMKEKPPRAVEA
jgi:hypothetical protein